MLITRIIITTSLVGLAALSLGQNLVVNPDFSAGFSGFASDYEYAPAGNTAEGQFTVRSDPQNWNGEFAPTGDHTTGTGNMLIVNGATDGSPAAWRETLTVSLGATYNFGVWVSTAVAGGPADLIVKVNGTQLGASFTAPEETGTWVSLTRQWNSGASTSALIEIVDTNLNRFPNDFYIDDVSFGAVPEPISLAGLGLGIYVLCLKRRSRITRSM